MENIFKKIAEYIKKNKKSVLASTIFVVVVYFILFSFIGSMNEKLVKEMDWNEFKQHLYAEEVDLVYYNPSMEHMSVILFNDETKTLTSEKDRLKAKHDVAERYRVLYPGNEAELAVTNNEDDADMRKFRQSVIEHNAIPVVTSNSSVATGLLSLFGTVLIYGGMIFIVMKVMNANMRGISEKDVIQTSDVKFENIIGHEEIIDDIHFITDLIKDPTKGDSIGAKLPKGILFAGPPGTGKTLLAKAIANEAGVPFLYQNASGFIEMYVGLGAKRVRDLFKIARKHAPCIIFIDEIDAIGGDRSSGRGSSENEQTINALLQEMDGFAGRNGIFIIAATNRPESLDPALVRSGRFDRQINVNPPRDWVVRKEMFEHYLEKFKVDESIDIDNISKEVSGFTGADIAMVCNEASIIAVMKDKPCIDVDCIEEAIDKKVFNGNRAKRKPHVDDMAITAYHEAGHAVMDYLVGTPIARASIQSTTSGVGGAVIMQDKVTAYMTKGDLENMILVAYAGRASEEIKFKDPTTGASNDITKATDILKQYVGKLGFDVDTGLIDTDVLVKSNIIDMSYLEGRISAVSVAMYDKCKRILAANYEMVEVLAQKLLECESISGPDIEEMLGKIKKVDVD